MNHHSISWGFGVLGFLVLGPSWKCFFNAMANINCIVTLHCSIRKKSRTNILGGYTVYYNIYLKYVWNFFSKIWNIKFCTYIC